MIHILNAFMYGVSVCNADSEHQVIVLFHPCLTPCCESDGVFLAVNVSVIIRPSGILTLKV